MSMWALAKAIMVRLSCDLDVYTLASLCIYFMYLQCCFAMVLTHIAHVYNAISLQLFDFVRSNYKLEPCSATCQIPVWSSSAG